MAYQIFYSNQVQKYLSKQSESKISRILTRLKFVALDPLKKDNNIVRLVGTTSSYRLRMGDLRVTYHLDMSVKTIYVVKIAPRGSVYL